MVSKRKDGYYKVASSISLNVLKQRSTIDFHRYMMYFIFKALFLFLTKINFVRLILRKSSRKSHNVSYYILNSL